jgi:macrolide transport system ATP-binding/permease protein
MFNKLFRRKRSSSDFTAEIQSHIQLEIERLHAQGLTPEEAHNRAYRAFGNVTKAQERFYESRRWLWLDHLWQDVRYAARMLRKSFAFTAVAILTLALGIGANTAIFTLVDAVMLKSLPVAHPEQLYRLGDSDNCCQMTGTQNYGSFVLYSYPLYRYLQKHTNEFTGLAAFSPSLNEVSIRRSGTSEAAQPGIGEYVSGNYFETLGVRAAAGRLLTPADDSPSSPPAAVMSYHTWQQDYGRDPSVIGATFAFDGQPVTIVGVASQSFFGETLRSDPPDMWIPLSQEPILNRSDSLLNLPEEWWLYVIGRIRLGKLPSQAQAHLTVELQQWLWRTESAEATPEQRNDAALVQEARQWLARQHIHLTPAGSGVTTLRSATSEDLLFLMIVSGVVLLITCANIANLLLARSMAKRQEVAIRVALGAGRLRLIRQTLTEGALLALLGGVAGLAIAFAGTRAILLLAFRDAVYIPIDPRPSPSVLGFTLLLALLTGLIFSAAPAWMTSHTRPIEGLREARSTHGGSVFSRKALVVLQAALSLVLLVGAGLLTQSLHNLEHQQFGFATQGRLLVRVDPALAGYTQARLPGLYQQIEQHLATIPGVLSVSLSNYGPLDGTNPNTRVSIEGRPPAASPSISWDQVSAHYFDTIGTRILRGRGIMEQDTFSSPRVAVINEAFSRLFFRNENPIGRRFGTGGASHSGDFEIVGVVQDAKYINAAEPANPMFFLPLLQPPAYIHDIELRVAGHPKNLNVEIRRALNGIDSNLTVLGMMGLGEQVDLNFYRQRLVARLTLLYGLLALALASVGLYGVASYVVARRTNEIGVRVALGATRASIVTMILRDSMSQIVLALIIGLPVALLAGAAMSSALYGVKSHDPLVLAAATIALVGCTLFGALVPARRATRVDPIIALRYE